MQITRELLQVLRPKLEAAIAPIMKEFGIVGRVGNASYAREGTSGTFKLELATQDAGGNTMTKDAEAYRTYAALYKWKVALFATVDYNGKKFKVVGYLPRSAKFPILAENLADGKTYKLPERVVNPVFASATVRPAPISK